MQHKVPYTVEANGAVYFRIKKNVYNFYIIILEMIIQLRNHIDCEIVYIKKENDDLN